MGFITQESQLVSGFAALQALAGAGGTLTAASSAWSQLSVWVDQSGSGVFSQGELYSLNQLGITLINLNATQTNTTNNGNIIQATSTFQNANGTTGALAGVDFAYNPQHVAPDRPARKSRLLTISPAYPAFST
jgi:hypothetical protein